MRIRTRRRPCHDAIGGREQARGQQGLGAALMVRWGGLIICYRNALMVRWGVSLFIAVGP
jgi:hypothetical protein